MTPGAHLHGVTTTAAHVALLAPSLADSLADLADELAAAMPSGGTPGAAHGDFHLGQVMSGDGEPSLIDFDHLCRADPAYDLATTASNSLGSTGRATWTSNP